MAAPDSGGGASGALGALRANRNFRLLWIGQVLSDLGTQIGTLAYPLLEGSGVSFEFFEEPRFFQSYRSLI